MYKKMFGFHAETNNQGLLTAIKNILPSPTDANIYNNMYEVFEGEGETMDYRIDGQIVFVSDSERNTFYNSINGLNGIFIQCSDSSFFQFIDTDNHQPDNIRTSSIITSEVLSNGSN